MVVLIPLPFFDSAKVANFIELCKYFVRFPLKTHHICLFSVFFKYISTFLEKRKVYQRLHTCTLARYYILKIEVYSL